MLRNQCWFQRRRDPWGLFLYSLSNQCTSQIHVGLYPQIVSFCLTDLLYNKSWLCTDENSQKTLEKWKLTEIGCSKNGCIKSHIDCWKYAVSDNHFSRHKNVTLSVHAVNYMAVILLCFAVSRRSILKSFRFKILCGIPQNKIFVLSRHWILILWQIRGHLLIQIFTKNTCLVVRLVLKSCRRL